MDSDSNPMERASRRLAAALDALEAAVERCQEAQRSVGALDSEIQSLSQDRSRLAQDLDRARARSARLDSVTDHVTERLDAAIASISELLDGRRPT